MRMNIRVCLSFVFRLCVLPFVLGFFKSARFHSH